MKNKKIKYIYEDLYDLNIWYFKDCLYSDMQDYLRTEFGFNGFRDVINVGGSVIPLDVQLKKTGKCSKVYCLWLPSDASTGIIAHEVFHIANHLLKDRGLELTDSSEEAYAYLITWICDQL